MTAVGYTSGDPRKVNLAGYVKGDVLAANTAGTLTAVPVGADTEVFTADSTEAVGVDWEPGGGGGGGTPGNTVVTEQTYGQAAAAGVATPYSRVDHTHGTPPPISLDGGFRGVWSGATAYRIGDTVVFSTGLYGALVANTNSPPVTVLNSLTTPPVEPNTVDGADIECIDYLTVVKRVRLTGIGFWQSSLEVNSPHNIRFWNADLSQSTPIILTTAPTETPGGTNPVFANFVMDLLPGVHYAVSRTTGTGGDTGYARTHPDVYPIASGSVRTNDSRFNGSVGTLVGATNFQDTNYFSMIRFEEPNDAVWQLIGRFDPLTLEP